MSKAIFMKAVTGTGEKLEDHKSIFMAKDVRTAMAAVEKLESKGLRVELITEEEFMLLHIITGIIGAHGEKSTSLEDFDEIFDRVFGEESTVH